MTFFLAHRWMAGPGSATASWQRALGYGALFSVAVVASETLRLPLDNVTWLEATRSIFWAWVLTGIGIAWFAFAAERRGLSIPRAVAWLLLAAAILSGLQSAVWRLSDVLGLAIHFPPAFSEKPPSWTNFFYHLWASYFHGALLTAACMLILRAERTRHLLGYAEIARGKTEALLADAQLESLRARVDPAFLLRAMNEVQQRYAHDAPAADHLLDQLVGFLRLAMPAVRGGTSTLSAELELAQAYARLSEQIDPLRGRWRFVLDAVPAGLSFPPLLLLPLLDQLTSPLDTGHCGEVRLSAAPGELCLEIHGAAAATPLTEDAVRRVKVALQASFGAACNLRIDRAAQPGIPTLSLRLQLAKDLPERTGSMPHKELLYG